MVSTDALEWRRRFPTRPLRRLAWYVHGGGAVVAGSWLLFASEPTRLPSGEANSLVLVPAVTTGLVLFLTGIPLMTLFRRPRVAADHYALTIRPGAGRTLLLPWAEVTDVALVPTRNEPVLAVRCARPDPARGRYGDRPRWYDRFVLRSCNGALAGWDVAVRADEFAGDGSAGLAALAAWAPDHVRVADHLVRR